MTKVFDSRRVALAAITGLSLATVACKGAAAEGTPSTEAVPAAATASSDKACCKGLNECKGKGGCAAPGKNECAGKNECKGKGGCNMHCPKQ
jgi:hypothetical protein